MAALSANNQNTIKNGGKLEREWSLRIPYAKLADYQNLAYNLLNEAQYTDFRHQAGTITLNWLRELRPNQNAAKNTKGLVALMENIPQPFKLMISLSSGKRAFMSKMFSMETTLCILSSDDAEDICIISKDPTTQNIYDYCAVYSDVLASGNDFFDFFVCGEQETDECRYNVKITKGDWNAINRQA